MFMPLNGKDKKEEKKLIMTPEINGLSQGVLKIYHK
jgi:hypothetical protein